MGSIQDLGNYSLGTTNSIPRPFIIGGIDIIEEMANYVGQMILGNSYVIDSEDEKLLKLLKKIAYDNRLQQILEKALRMNFIYGRCILTINLSKPDKDWPKGFPTISIGNPLMWTPVARYGERPIQAVVWQKLLYDIKEYWLKFIFYENKREALFWDNNKQVIIDQSQSKLLYNKYKIAPVLTYNWGFLPLEETWWKPIYQPYTQQVNNHYPAWWPIRHLVKLFGESQKYLDKETKSNRTRLILPHINPAEYERIKRDFPNKDISDTDITMTFNMGTNTNPGGGDPLVIQMGDPKFEAYTELVKQYKRWCYEGVILNAPSQSNVQQTQGEVMLNNSRDTETSTYQIRYLNDIVKRLFCKILVMIGEYETTDEADENFSFNILSNIPIDTMNETNELTLQVQAGFKTKAEAIAELRNIPMKEAREKADEIRNEEEKDMLRAEKNRLEVQGEAENQSLEGQAKETENKKDENNTIENLKV